MVLLPGLWGAALALGAGLYSKFVAEAEWEHAKYLIAGGAGLFGISMWFATSGDPMLRVGDGGVAIDRETLVRIPWHLVKAVRWNEKRQSLEVEGTDEGGSKTLVEARVRTQPQAAAWLLKEAEARIPNLLELSDSAREQIPHPVETPANELVMPALQVAGRRCAHSNKMITYPKDARICPTCERIYHRKQLPDKCPCGTLQSEFVAGAASTDSDNDEEGEAA